MGWARRFTTGLLGQSPEPASCLCHSASIPRAVEPEIASTSPACILAKSLTDPETRGEWARKFSGVGSIITTEYRNAGRDITITHSVLVSSYISSNTLSTPFSLTKDEERVLRWALVAFDKHEKDERERAALARLTAKPSRRKT